MPPVSIGDMARHFQLRSQNADLRARLGTLTQELTTGVKSDLAGAVSGDFKVLASLDHRLRLLDSYRTATSEAEVFAQSVQTVLGAVQSLSGDLAPPLLNAGTTGGAQAVATAAADSGQKLQAVVAALNTQIADRFLLSGTATDRRPLTGATAILTGLAAATAGQVTATGVIAAVQGWFAAPSGGGGFRDLVYGGSLQPNVFEIGPGDSAALDVTALDPAVLDILEGLALASLVDGGALAGDDAGRALLTRTAGETLVAAGSDMAALRARIGSVEAHVAESAERNAGEAAALGIARTGITAADPYETATRLEAVQTQIETLYSITARLARLSLADFLR